MVGCCECGNESAGFDTQLLAQVNDTGYWGKVITDSNRLCTATSVCSVQFGAGTRFAAQHPDSNVGL